MIDPTPEALVIELEAQKIADAVCDNYAIRKHSLEWAMCKASALQALRTGQLIHAVPSRPAPCMGMAQNCPWVEGQKEKCSCEQPSEDEVEAVARKLAPFMEGGREYDQMPATRRELKIWSRNGMALINDATHDDAQEAATAAITALDAHRGKP